MKQAKFDVTVSPYPPLDWDRWVIENSQYAGARQLACRAKLYDVEHSGEGVFISCEQSGSRVSGTLLSWIPPRNNSLIRKVASVITGVGNGHLIVFEGPVVSKQRFDALPFLFQSIDDVASKLRVSSIKFTSLPCGYVALGQEFWEQTFTTSGYVRHEWLTSVVDLQMEEGDYFKFLRAKERNTIRKCQKAGVFMFKCDTREAYLEDFCRNYYENKWSEKRRESCERQWRYYDPEHFSFYVAKSKEGKVLGTLGTYHLSGYVTVRLINRTVICKKMKMPVQDFLHWSVINQHRSLGDKFLDLAGIAPNPADAKEKGIRFFKEKWGGVLRAAPSFLKDRRPLWLSLLHQLISK